MIGFYCIIVAVIEQHAKMEPAEWLDADAERPTGNAGFKFTSDHRGTSAMQIAKDRAFVDAEHCPHPHQAVSADPGRRRLYERPMVSKLKIEQVIQNAGGSADDFENGFEKA